MVFRWKKSEQKRANLETMLMKNTAKNLSLISTDFMKNSSIISENTEQTSN